MSLLREIQNEASSSTADIASLLRKCKILAARLGSQEFTDWVSRELDGYPEGPTVPEYRRINGACYGQFVSIAWQVNRGSIIPEALPKWAQDVLSVHEFRQGIAGIQSFTTGDAIINEPRLALVVQGKMFPGMTCLRVWFEYPAVAFQNLVSAVLTRVLDFALEIERLNPAAGEAPPSSTPVPLETLRPIVMNTFHGTVNNVAQSSSNFTQNAANTIEPVDLDSLRRALAKAGVSEERIGDLSEAIQSDAQDGSPSSSMGKRVMAWLGAFVSTAGANASTELVVAAIKAFFGMS